MVARMGKRHLVLVTLAALAAAPGAARAGRDLPDAPYGQSTRGKSYWRDIENLFLGALRQACVADDPDRWRAGVDEWTRTAEKLTDAADRQLYLDYLKTVRAFVDAHAAGVPGVGTYAELRTAFAADKTAFEAAFPAAPATTPEAVRAAVAGYRDYVRRAGRLVDLHERIKAASPCAHVIGDWRTVAAAAAEAPQRVARGASAQYAPLLSAFAEWKAKAGPLAKPVPASWWEHTEHALAIVELTALTQRVAPSAPLLGAWAELLDGNDKAAALEASTALPAALERLVPLAVELVRDVRLPVYPKNAGREKLLKAKLASSAAKGKLVGFAAGPAKESEQRWTERDPLDGLEHGVTRRHYSTYYVWDPVAPPEGFPALPGIAPDDVCELWHQSFRKHTRGGPSAKPLNKVVPFQSWRAGYMLCAHARTPTKKSMK